MARISEVRVGLPCPARPEEVVVRFRGGDGRFVDASLDRFPAEDVLAGLPVREVRWYRGRLHYSGWYWAATTGGHVVYESRLELARMLLADGDPDVVAMAAQPVWMAGMDDGRVRRHVPDLLLAHRGGGLTFVDVKAASRLADERVVKQFAWMRQVCDRFGFGFEVWSGIDPVVLENVRFLAGYRAPVLIRGELLETVLAAAREPVPLGQVERVVAQGSDRARVRPVALHALWRGLLEADLTRPLDVSTLVVDWARQHVNTTMEIVKRSDAQRGFVVLPRRWVVERTLAWLVRHRRLARDYERCHESHEELVRWAMTRLMTRRLARAAGPASPATSRS